MQHHSPEQPSAWQHSSHNLPLWHSHQTACKEIREVLSSPGKAQKEESHSIFRHTFSSRPCQHALMHALFIVKQHTSSDEVSWVAQPRCSDPLGGSKAISPSSPMYVSQQNGPATSISTISEKKLSKIQGYPQVSSPHSPH